MLFCTIDYLPEMLKFVPVDLYILISF